MTLYALHALIANREDTHRQFKRDFAYLDALTAELVAISNNAGGMLLYGGTL